MQILGRTFLLNLHGHSRLESPSTMVLLVKIQHRSAFQDLFFNYLHETKKTQHQFKRSAFIERFGLIQLSFMEIELYTSYALNLRCQCQLQQMVPIRPMSNNVQEILRGGGVGGGGEYRRGC